MMHTRRRLIVFVAVSLATLVGVFFGMRWWQERALRLAIDAIRARGEPITAEDLDAMYVAPVGDQNCTSLYLHDERAYFSVFRSRLKVFPLLDLSVPAPALDEPWEDLPVIEEALAQSRTDLDRWYTAASQGGKARFSVRFADGYNTVLNHVSAHSYIIRSLLLEAHVRAYQKDFAGAADSLYAAIVCLRALDNEPIAMTQIVRMHLTTQVVSEIKLLLPQVEFRSADLQRLQQALADPDFHRALRIGLLGDRVMALDSAADASKMQLNTRWQFAVHRATSRQLGVRLLAEFDKMLALAERPWPEIVASTSAVPPLSKRPQLPAYALDLVPEFLSHLSDYLRLAAKATSASDIGVLSLALTRYREDHGRFPATLAELVPDYVAEIPPDQMTGQPLTYTLDEQGMTLKSEWKDVSSKIDPTTGADKELLFYWPATKREAISAQ